MGVMSRIYRKASELASGFASGLRKWKLKLQYPSLSIDSASYIGRNCRITCADAASMVITASQIADGCLIKADGNGRLSITRSSIGPSSVIVAMQSVQIGDNCSIAEMVVIRDQDHNFGSGMLIKDSGYTTAPVSIGSNVWIGAKASILKGVSIGSNSVVGAHSLVNATFPGAVLIAGAPAKLIRTL
jgi:NDP-sugar pyrophosphorylase family protein